MNIEKYLKLLAKFPPRPIRTEELMNETQNVIDKLEESEKQLSEEEEAYISVLKALRSEYEDLFAPFMD